MLKVDIYGEAAAEAIAELVSAFVSSQNGR
jgi:hypothetical protein